MSPNVISSKGVDVHLWSPVNETEEKAIVQLKNIASLPWVFHHVAAMADTHLGVGATVGSVVAMKDAVSPAAVGVDIGCGMGAMRTSLRAHHLPDNLEKIRSRIEQLIPVGFNSHEKVPFNDFTPYGMREALKNLFSEFSGLHDGVYSLLDKAQRQLGTLGGGNHFIELSLDTEGCVWMMLHSGSRNIGKVLAEHHISVAKKLAHNNDIPDLDLAVFLSGTSEMKAYRNDLFWAQRYAFLNRQVMFLLYQDALKMNFPDIGFDAPILCHHNYVSEETHFGEDVIVTRKGAISAQKGELGIIPGSMGTKSYIVRGLGNPESFCSASHGAGRRLSRGAAKRKFTTADLIEQTQGVCCRKDADVIDEIPAAYKDIEQVMRNQADLVEIVVEMKQLLCVKG